MGSLAINIYTIVQSSLKIKQFATHNCFVNASGIHLKLRSIIHLPNQDLWNDAGITPSATLSAAIKELLPFRINGFLNRKIHLTPYISPTSNYIIQFPVMEDAKAAGKHPGVSKLGIIQFFNFGRTVAFVNWADGSNGGWATSVVSAYSADDSSGCFKSSYCLLDCQLKNARTWSNHVHF